MLTNISKLSPHTRHCAHYAKKFQNAALFLPAFRFCVDGQYFETEFFKNQWVHVISLTEFSSGHELKNPAIFSFLNPPAQCGWKTFDTPFSEWNLRFQHFMMQRNYFTVIREDIKSTNFATRLISLTAFKRICVLINWHGFTDIRNGCLYVQFHFRSLCDRTIFVSRRRSLIHTTIHLSKI